MQGARGGHFEIVWPSGRTAYAELPVGERPSDLSGRTVGFLWDWFFRGDQLWALVKEELARRFPGMRFVDHEVFGNTHGRDDRAVLEALAERLRANNVDAVISGIGA
jgi:hypothetical protein